MKTLIIGIAVSLFSINLAYSATESGHLQELNCEQVETKEQIYFSRTFFNLNYYFDVRCDGELVQNIDINRSNKNRIVGEVYRELILQDYVIEKCQKESDSCIWVRR